MDAYFEVYNSLQASVVSAALDRLNAIKVVTLRQSILGVNLPSWRLFGGKTLLGDGLSTTIEKFSGKQRAEVTIESGQRAKMTTRESLRTGPADGYANTQYRPAGESTTVALEKGKRQVVTLSRIHSILIDTRSLKYNEEPPPTPVKEITLSGPWTAEQIQRYRDQGITVTVENNS